MRPRSATACGLRATALRCSAPRASSQGRRRGRPAVTADRTAPTRAPRPRCAGRPWAPARLAAPEFASRPPPPPRSTTSPRFVESELKCARRDERERQARMATAPARAIGLGLPMRRAARSCRHAANDVLARLRERTLPSLPKPSEEAAERGGWGVLFRDFGSGEARRCPGLPSAARPRSMSGAARQAASVGLLRRDLATKPWAPSTAAQSREGRRP